MARPESSPLEAEHTTPDPVLAREALEAAVGAAVVFAAYFVIDWTLGGAAW